MSLSDRPLHPELLAPAGDAQAMRAAVANGANAVYFGLGNFNARHRANNFGLAELPEVMKYLHDHNVRGYVALNTLIFSDELEEAAGLVRACAAAGVDALIVQDLGLACLIHALAPTLPIHGSTQMTLTEPRGVAFVGQLGVGRVILARELSLDEIRRLAAASPLPLEVFVHGALCVAYSGQCLTSESLGGRSANRGQCAQACRLPYDLIVDGQHRDLGDKAYLLSPQDLAAHDLIGELVEAGISALKIEGRLKSAHYVAATTQTYRAALDAALARKPFVISPQQRQDLAQSFSRGFTHGFLAGPDHQTLVHARFPKSRGVRVGVVVAKSREGLVVDVERGRNDESAKRRNGEKTPRRAIFPIENQKSKIENPFPLPLKPGDGVVFDEGHPEQDEQGGRVLSVRPVESRASKAPQIHLAFHAGDVNLSAVAVGSIVWKTDDPALRKRLEQSFAREGVANRIPLNARVRASLGQKLQVMLSDPEGRQAQVEWDQPLAKAEKFPLSADLLREQLGRLGQTPFELAALELTNAAGDGPADPVMVPKSVLNDLRRQATEALLQQRSINWTHPIADPAALEKLRSAPPPHRPAPPGVPCLTILTRTLEQLAAVLDWQAPASARPAMVYCDFEDIRRYKEAVALARDAAMPIALATLRIVKPAEEGLLKQIADCAPDAVLVRNLAAVSYYAQRRMTMIGDYALNIANELTAALFAQAGLLRMTPSYDLNWPQLAALLSRFPADRFEAVIHQHMPMFHMEHCVFAHTLSSGTDYRTCGRPCDRHQVDLRDRVGQSHPLVADVGCRNTVFNGQAQSAAEYLPRMLSLGLRHFRVELLREKAQDVAPLLNRYAELLAGKIEPRAAVRSLRVLNQLGVTAGTLEHD